jgi:outer membrane receptor protein involved in Fe transport
MHSPQHLPCPHRRTALSRLLGRGVVCLFLLTQGFLWAQSTRRSFDLPADSAERSLKLLSTQAGVEVLFGTETAAGNRTAAVRGQFTPLEAAERLLAGTRLAVTQDASSGALVIGRADAARPSPGPRVAKSTFDPSQAQMMEEVEVTGSRIRGLLGEATIQPILTLTAEEIDRTGATSLGEAFRWVPQVSSYTEGNFLQSGFAFGASSGDSTSTRVTASLRGSPAGGTLLLINGRRAPRTGQEFSSQEGYDLSGIPLASIERVEVLLDGASAIYGADAVGGVINVILKRNYRRTDLRLGYENTFDKDAHVFTSSLSHGFGKGKFSGSITLSSEQSGNLMWVDRDFLRTQDRRAWGGTNNPAAQIPSANGTISVTAGNTAGVPAGTLLTIPRGSTGTNSTPAQFVAAGSPPAPPGTDLAIWAAYNSPYERRNLVSSAEYDWRPNLTAFAEFRAAMSETDIYSSPLAISSLSIPANAPGNVFGVPVTMRRYLLDLPKHTRTSKTRNLAGAIGLRGKLGHDWRFESSIGYTHTRPDYYNPLGFSASNANFTAALNNPDPSKRPNLFYDATTGGLNPNAPGVLEAIGAPQHNLEIGQVWTYEAKADGPLYKIWAGDIRTAVGAEYREEYVDFPLQTPPGNGTLARNRYVTGMFTEVRVPLVAEKQNWPLLNRVEVTAAVRQDQYQEFKGATKPRYGALYRPVKWVMFRGSYGEGYKLPTLSQLYAPVTTTTGTIGGAGLVDIYRGNEAFIGNQLLTIGGNPNLVPEETESTSAGVVLEVPGKWFKGLSFSYDYYDHNYLNRIASLSVADRLMVFPELFVRGPRLPTDPPGWPGPLGPVLTYDGRSVNVSTNRITGWDAGLKYFRPTRLGDFSLGYNASRTYRNESRPRPGAPPATTAVKEAFPLKMSGSLFWKKGWLESTALMSYKAPFKRTLTERFTPSAIRWDWRAGVDFAKTAWANREPNRRWARWLADSRVNLSIFNVLDTDPPMSSAGLPEASLLDARGRRYSITFSKSFGAGVPRR